MQERLKDLSSRIDSTSSYESQESLQATAEKEAAETAVHDALEFYN
jgi:predicted DNA-binding protein